MKRNPGQFLRTRALYFKASRNVISRVIRSFERRGGGNRERRNYVLCSPVVAARRMRRVGCERALINARAAQIVGHLCTVLD